MTSVPFRDPLGDGQAQTGPAGGSSPGIVRPVEAFENVGQVLCGDTDARILHGKTYMFFPELTIRRILPPAGVYLMALSIKMRQACLTRP